MAIRQNALPNRGDLSADLQDILRRNGMQAHIIADGDAYKLAVQGHDSPLLTYNVSAKQMQALNDWGTNYANKHAYDTFADIVAKDFYLPKNFVHARNANGRVAMGLHGYRVGVREYGRMPWDRRAIHPVMDSWHGRFLGWTPRQQEGFHMRRVGGALFMQGAPMVPERPDGRMKPGELQSGAYGFYYKGQQSQAMAQPTNDVLADLQAVVTPVAVRPRPKDPAIPYNDLITSKVYFSNEKWQQCLESHGIIIDPEKKQLTIQSEATKTDMVYDLTDEELKKLTSNNIKQVPVQQRLDIINNLIRNDFDDKITMAMLNSKDRITIRLNPAVEAELNGRQQQIEQQAQPIGMDGKKISPEEEDRAVGHVDGKYLYDLNEDKGWFREGRHGREVSVDDIKVEPVRNEQGEIEKDKKGEGKYRMTAVINGEAVTHEITQKQYDKFMAIDDYHRMKLFAHIFHEVDMKNMPGTHANIGAQIGGALLAGLAVVDDIAHAHRPSPAIFEEHHEGPRHTVYMKPGVDSPQDIAARAFDAGVNAAEHGVGMGHQR